MELSSQKKKSNGTYGAVGLEQEEEVVSPRMSLRELQRSRLAALKDNKSWQALPSSSVRVETFSSAFSRKEARHLARTASREVDLGDAKELTLQLQRMVADSSSEKKDEKKWLSFMRPPKGDEAALRLRVDRATNWSLGVNVVLTAVKIWSAWISGSLAVLASLVDSFLDLAQTGVLFIVEKQMALPPDKEFPAGRTRLEPVGVIICAMLMAVGSVGVIFESVETLGDAFFREDDSKKFPTIDINRATLAVLIVTVLSKGVLWLYCVSVADESSTALALAEDHANDVASNAVAILACGLAAWHPSLWWVDASGAIFISLYIINNWFYIGMDHVSQIVGKGATDHQLRNLAALATSHDPARCKLETIRAYHFDPAFLVEILMSVNDDSISVSHIHHLSTSLAETIEDLDWVERCFVNVKCNSPGVVLDHSTTPTNARQSNELFIGDEAA